jgi:hypothetical protein
MSSIVTSGKGTMQNYELMGMGVNGQPYSVAANSSIEPLTATQRQDWLKLINQSSQALRVNPASSKGGVAFGFRHHFLNPNTVRLASLIQGVDLFKLPMIAPLQVENSVKGYVDWLTTKDGADACLLLTFSGEQGIFMPIVSDKAMVKAAQIAGFTPAQSWLAPTGQQLLLWKRDLPENACK